MREKGKVSAKRRVAPQHSGSRGETTGSDGLWGKIGNGRSALQAGHRGRARMSFVGEGAPSIGGDIGRLTPLCFRVSNGRQRGEIWGSRDDSSSSPPSSLASSQPRGALDASADPKLSPAPFPCPFCTFRLPSLPPTLHLSFAPRIADRSVPGPSSYFLLHSRMAPLRTPSVA